MRTIPWWRTLPALGAMLAMAGVVLADLVLGGFSGTPPSFLQFLGRFHPLLVHLPIGFFLLIAAAEALSLLPRFAPRVEPAIGLALIALVASALVAFVLGHLLSREGGFPAQALGWHRRLTLIAILGASGCLLAWTYHAEQSSRGGRTLYRALLVLSLGVLSLGAHFGGSMTRGDDYLAKFAPGPLRPLLGGKSEAPKAAPAASGSAAARGAEPLLFADMVLPLFREHCTECHGAEKVKGGLRLDSLEAIAKGGEGGPALVAGSARDSALVQRMLLPETDDDRMPPEGKNAPSAEAIALVGFWIDRGATSTLRVRDALPPVNARALLERAASAAPLPEGNTPVGAGSAAPAPAGSAEVAPPTAESDAAPDANGAADEPARSEPSEVAEEPPSDTAAAGPTAQAILADKCEKCHGAAKQKGGLRVDSLEAMLRGGEGGPALIRGAPERSELLLRIQRPLTAKGHMPPKKELQLGAEETRVLAAWIRALAGGGARDPAASSQTVSESSRGAESETRRSAQGETRGDSGATPSGAAAQSAAAASETAAPPAHASAAGTPPRLPERVALYRDVVRPLLDERCGMCHSGGQPSGRLAIEPYARLLAGGQSARGFVPGAARESYIVKRMRLPLADDDHMPPEGEPQLEPGELELVELWIDRGAGAELEIASSELAGDAARAAASRLRAPEPEAAAEAAAAPPAEAGLAVRDRPAGCAACAIGRESPLPFEALALVAAGGVALVVRRRRARALRATSR